MFSAGEINGSHAKRTEDGKQHSVSLQLCNKGR
jgi:hypothetical protein